jgi:hypothetical protein
MAAQDSPDTLLRDEFRRHLQLFYSRLKLAPPYHSVEKALALLTIMLKTIPAVELQQLVADPPLRWAYYRKAFVESGLSQKHRGIIAGLARDRRALELPEEFDTWLDLYVTRS